LLEVLDMVRIIVTKHATGYQAHFGHDPGQWGSGSSPQAAIGDLILTHQSPMRIEIVLPADGQQLKS